MMLFTRSILFFCAFLFAEICYSQTITGVNCSFQSGEDGIKVYIESNKGKKDSATIKNNEVRFELKNIGSDWDVYFVNYKSSSKRYAFPLFINSQSVINFKVGEKFEKVTFSGDKVSLEQNVFYKGLDDLSENYKAIQKKITNTKDSIELVKLNGQLKHADAAYEVYFSTWINEHKTSPFSVAVIRMFIDKSNVLKQLDTVAAKSFDALAPQAKENNFQTLLLQRGFSLYDAQYGVVATDELAPSFIIKDTSGYELSLNTYRGKWLVIDFWASWCAPCRQNNPLLKSLYLKYREKGLNVLSISADTDVVKWKNAINKDGMTWQQGSDLLGMNEGVLSRYYIQAVPCYFLISPEGKIVAKSIGGDINLMEEQLNAVLAQ